ncbi:hypothetical protein LOZ61_000539 [Ophidiomyces ophidiicola]|uniref:Uncharacterized protein n=1 Tax=Ophidiomyces ophidiicola TaxID=1387563 RepID=A0ACB8URH7_9EURO|nr:hypothetical protein LOZ61_000539 [Ophidiomyces ophidiicola]KAI1921582.1 hypothetical protein LOZ60_006132 [Ophidiomyces ophidiicola]KAI1962689.1 hypothetical protein LOZ59_002025 [Ophidiomyces ophidiicola]KAI2054228.1 hypothetical protein LOZ43_004047 [Ophidiomyces ophidiicola]KAI2123950.1 hypothetical protein LOZ31_004414 [Ophidiomyces ophidiicola]
MNSKGYRTNILGSDAEESLPKHLANSQNLIQVILTVSISSGRHSETRSTPTVNSAAESQSTIESLKSLNTLIRQISLDLCPQEEAVTSLGNWLKTISPEEYTQIPQWTPEMWAAYNDYKAKAEEQGRAHKAYLAFSASHPKPSDPDENLERARLAIIWGQMSLAAAEARLSFLGEYQNAFENKVSIQNHIEEASKQIVSGRNAIKKARRSHNDLWNKNPGKANPEVFDDVI